MLTSLVELIPRVTNQGMTADFNRLTNKGSAFTAAEDGSLDEANDTYERVSKQIKFLYAVGRVTGPAQAAQSSFILQGAVATGTGLNENPFSSVAAPTTKQIEILAKVRALREKEEDFNSVYEVNKQAFKQIDEGELIKRIRAGNNFIPELSLVAEENGNIIGYILFSKIKILGKKEFESLALAPMAVLPKFKYME